MNEFDKKNIQKTSGIHKKYKPRQLVAICKDVFRIRKTHLLLQIVTCVI